MCGCGKKCKGCRNKGGINRRQFLKMLGAVLASSAMPIPLIGTKEAHASLNPLDWINLIDLGCINCNVDLTGCVKVSLTGVKIAPKITYWMPMGFMESGLAWEIGKSLPFGEILGKAYAPIQALLEPFVPKGTNVLISAMAGMGGESHLKLYPHWIGFPPSVKQAIGPAIQLLDLNPTCLACNLTSAISDSINPVSKITNTIEEQLGPIADEIQEIQELQQMMNQINNAYSTIFPMFPAVLSEMFFFIWNIEEFSPDVHTIAPAIVGAIQSLRQVSPELSAITCPNLTMKLEKYLPNIAGVDMSFACVGRWGFGYPRIGIVRHDDPVVAMLLSMARFHHLFSTTIPIIKTKFSFDNIKYQMYSPQKSGCSRPGYIASDQGVKAMYSAEDFLNNLTSLKVNPSDIKGNIQNAFNQMKDQVKDIASNPAGAVAGMFKQRNAGVVVWEKFTKCCW